MTNQKGTETKAGKAPRAKKRYIPAVTPRLKIALVMLFTLFALLAANSIYLAAITSLEAITGLTYQDFFYLCMFILHLVLGILIIVPFIIFAFFHLVATRNRKNRRAVRIGYALLFVSIVLLGSGILLTRVGNIELRHEATRIVVYFAHVLAPLAAIWLYWLHRLAGPPIRWRVGLTYVAMVAGVLIPMIILQFQDPRQWSVSGSPEGEKYFEPSLVRTSDGNFIPPEVLDNDEYCLKCHQDVYEDWSHSVHRFSSFNNPAYLTSIVELREQLIERDGDVRASRWCAGCHDPVPFFGGSFDDPNFDVDDPTGQAGITCTTCHAITHVNSARGNADYVIEEPIHYPFAYSDNPFLQWVNNQLVKAKPSFHKKVMLKPLHKTSEFCGTCHKVHLPKELNHYKDFLRGQNHYDPWLLSGVSGHGLRSFYYPPQAQVNCNECHMPRKESNDFGAKDFAGTGKLEVHDHLFPSANTAIAWLRDKPEIIERHREFLDGVMRVDIFGLKEGTSVDAELIGPLRPASPTLKPGQQYLLETVIRTVKMGHIFTQGTADSNEIWMDVTLLEDAKYDDEGNRVEGRVIGRSGGLDENGEVDRWAHFVNAFVIDRHGNRINRRNAHDIFTVLYNHQIPPGAGQVVHYQIDVPEDVNGTITVEVKLQYRKFDQEYMNIIADYFKAIGKELRGAKETGEYENQLPITTLASDRFTFAIEGTDQVVDNPPRDEIPLWQRWNDYGIGLFTEGALQGSRGELRQAEQAFKQVEALEQFHGPINLARVYESEGALPEAVEALERAVEYQGTEGYPAWTVLWLSGVISRQQGRLEDAIRNYEDALNYRSPETVKKNFNFTRDYVVINALGETYVELAQRISRTEGEEASKEVLKKAEAEFLKTLEIDVENFSAHNSLAVLYARMGDSDKAKHHRTLHERYKADDNAGDSARAVAREKYPAADKAAEALVIYSLNRAGAPELPQDAEVESATTTSSETAEQVISQNGVPNE